MGTILALGSSYDREAFDAVAAALASQGHDTVLFEQDKCLSGQLITVHADADRFDITIDMRGKTLPLGLVDVVWVLGPIADKRLRLFQPERYRDYISDQFHGMRQGIFYLKRHAPWVNEPWRIAKAEIKIGQLEMARRLGLAIPSTLITSDPVRIRDFWRSHEGKIVVKQLKLRPLEGEAFFTSRVTAKELENDDSLEMSPAIFQEEIVKDHELRVSVFGDQTFTVAIDSQCDPATALDWRVKPGASPMRPGEIPGAIAAKLRSMLDEYGLKTGMFDLVRTPDGRYVFLELNPNGQWYFLQKATGLPLAEAMADLLANAVTPVSQHA